MKYPKILVKSKSEILKEISKEALSATRRVFGENIFITDQDRKEWETICYVDLQEALDEFMSKNDMEYAGVCRAVVKFPKQSRNISLQIYWSRLDLNPIIKYLYICAFASSIKSEYYVEDKFSRVTIEGFNVRFGEDREETVLIFFPEEYTRENIKKYGTDLISFAKTLKLLVPFANYTVHSILERVNRIEKIVDFVENHLNRKVEFGSKDHLFLAFLSRWFNGCSFNKSSKSILFYNPHSKKVTLVLYVILFSNKVYYCVNGIYRKLWMDANNKQKIYTLEKNLVKKFPTLSRTEISNVISVLLLLDSNSGWRTSNDWDQKILKD